VTKQKTTVYLDDEVLRASRVLAARTGRRDSEVVEAALRRYLGFDALERVWARNRDLSEEEAMDLALKAVDEVRSDRR
jgi:predicted transcriptional regulator